MDLENQNSEFIVLTVYHTESVENSYAILSLLERLAQEVFGSFVGFGCSTLHLSQNGLRVCAYDSWQEKSDFLSAMGSPEAEAITRKIVSLALGIDPCVYANEKQVLGTAVAR